MSMSIEFKLIEQLVRYSLKIIALLMTTYFSEAQNILVFDGVFETG